MVAAMQTAARKLEAFRYSDPRGEGMWARVMGLLDEIDARAGIERLEECS